MSKRELDNLVSIGKLKPEAAEASEIEGLIRSGETRLRDAENEMLSIESRFDLAYNAAHAFSLAALRWHGYRPDKRYVEKMPSCQDGRPGLPLWLFGITTLNAIAAESVTLDEDMSRTMTTKPLRKSSPVSKIPRRARIAQFRKTSGRAPRIFLSYNRLDRELATRFAERLKEEGYAIANPVDGIEPGQNWLLVAGRALQNSDAVVLFLSAAALRSDATVRELEYVLSTKKFKDRVVPVLLAEDVSVPWIVRRLPFVSMRKEPAADVGRAAKAVVKELEQRLR